MKLPRIRMHLPSWKSAGLAVLSAILLILAFPDFEWSVLAWVALIPLLVAIDREQESGIRSLLTGWIWGVCFFTGSCWWLTFSPITYAGFPWPLAYFLLICVCSIVAVFPALFALIAAVTIRRAGAFAILWTPFIWIATEFLRFWITGNNWNAIAYSQAFGGHLLGYASVGGIYLVGFILLLPQTIFAALFLSRRKLPKILNDADLSSSPAPGILLQVGICSTAVVVIAFFAPGITTLLPGSANFVKAPSEAGDVSVVAIQPNVPMTGLALSEYEVFKHKHITLAENALRNLQGERPRVVIFPESPMNFLYEEDKDFQEFVRNFALRNNTAVLFNSAEPDPANKKYFNSAVMVDAKGDKVAQYDKIYLVPFGESVPAPLQGIVPAMVGSFSFGREYDLLPFGDAKGGIMICFESHFPNLSRRYVLEGADILVEMTNDGYLGPTPILRQHLANAVFRAVETNRPVLRVTNVGITTYIDEKGVVHDPTRGYTEDVRIWSAGKASGKRTIYVLLGDWFAWLSIIVTLWLLLTAIFRRRQTPPQSVDL